MGLKKKQLLASFKSYPILKTKIPRFKAAFGVPPINSVTIFEQKFITFGKKITPWAILKGFFGVWQNLNILLSSFNDIGQFFIALNGQILSK